MKTTTMSTALVNVRPAAGPSGTAAIEVMAERGERATRGRENDAWLVATAESLNADVVAADRAAFERLGDRYLRFR